MFCMRRAFRADAPGRPLLPRNLLAALQRSASHPDFGELARRSHYVPSATPISLAAWKLSGAPAPAHEVDATAAPGR
jgi:hypothetical protein